MCRGSGRGELPLEKVSSHFRVSSRKRSDRSGVGTVPPVSEKSKPLLFLLGRGVREGVFKGTLNVCLFLLVVGKVIVVGNLVFIISLNVE